ncbi:hypothetical protein SCREM1_71 [Synechococcus phage S-CREM1]|nr:hypothetical protein SCREM1_71 [Synechococcus phage S-CREM1]
MTIDELIENFKGQIQMALEDKQKLEEEFADTKLNPYGITTIDFEKRQEKYELIIKLQGAIEGLELAKQECGIA